MLLSRLKDFFYPVKSLKKDAFKCFSFGFLIAVLLMGFSISLQFLPQILADKSGTLLNYYILGLGVAAVSVIITSFSFRRSYSTFEEMADYLLVEKYLKKLILMEQSDYEKTGSGRFVEILTSGINTQVNFLMTILISIPISLLIVTLGTFNIFLTDKVLGVYVLIFLMILLALLTVFNKKLLGYKAKSKEFHIEIIRRFVRIIESRTETLFSNSLNSDLAILRYSYEHSIYRYGKSMDYIEGMFASGRLFVWGIRLFSLYTIGHSILTHNSNIGILMSIVVSIGIMDQTLVYFIDNYKNMVKNFPNIKKMWTVFDESSYFTNYDSGNDFNKGAGTIEFDKINFSYGTTKVFNDFSLKLDGGKKTALVGKSGGGKSTLVKLMIGLAKPESGKVMIDGQDVNSLKLVTLFKNIGYLSQDPGIFDGTVKENLLSGLNDVSEDKILKALNSAECSFVYNLEKGIDTEIGERGIMLSGGRKQRLAIAKIFLKNPEIVILDEPTSALDSYSEDAITKALNELTENKTLVIIAHRLQTVKSCDKILVIGDGKILEEGSHNELIKMNGHYAGMVDLRSGNIKE